MTMIAEKTQFKKARFNDLPTMWDGEATWCVSMGPVPGAIVNGKRAAICSLFFYPPNEIQSGQNRLLFNVVAPDRATVEYILRQLARARHALEAQIALGKLEKVGVVRNLHLVVPV